MKTIIFSHEKLQLIIWSMMDAKVKEGLQTTSKHFINQNHSVHMFDAAHMMDHLVSPLKVVEIKGFLFLMPMQKPNVRTLE